MTARELISSSLRLIGAIATGETPTAAEQSDALSVLNEIISSWNTDGMMLYSKSRNSLYSFTPGSSSYTLLGALIITEVTVENASTSPSEEFPVEIIQNLQEWAQLQSKSSLTEYPSKVYISKSVDPTDFLPRTRLEFWPTPSVANKIILYMTDPLSKFSSANDEVIVPEGYARALRYNLAVELAPEYGKSISPIVMGIANESKADLRRQNLEPVFLKSDALNLNQNGRYNILTGE